MNTNITPSLFNSVLESDTDGLRSKLYNKLDVNIKDSYDQNALHLAAYTGNSEIADILIRYGIDINHKDINGVSPLFKACASNSHIILKNLLNADVDTNCRDNKWTRSLHVCAAHNSVECLLMMLPRSLSINITDNEGRTAIHHAVANGLIENVKILLSNNASISASDKNGARPIHWAAARGDIEILNLLLDNDVNINIRDKDDYTALHVASGMGHIDVVIRLIETGAELDCVTSQGNNALHLASANNHTNIIEELIKALNSPHLFFEHLKSSNSNQGVLEDIKENYLVLIKERLESILNSRNYQGLTPLHILSQMDNAHSCVDLLLAYGANPNLLSENGKSPLHFAASRNQLKQALLLLKFGADVNIQDDHENTPLHIACRFGYEKFVHLLLEYKANAFLPGEDGMLPIHVATAFKNCGCMHKLLDNVTLKTHINNLEDDGFGRNLVHCAVAGGSLKCLETIIRLGGDIHHEDNLKQTPLHLAVKMNNFMIARILMKLGALCEVEDEYTCTPIHYAAMYNKEGDILKLLIENGANVLTPVNINDNLTFVENNMMDNTNFGKKQIVYPVHFAVVSGNFNGMIILLEMMSDEAKMKCVKGHVDSSHNDYQSKDDVISLVNLAAYHDHFDILNHLIRIFTKSVVLTQDRNGRTALHLAAYQGHATNVKFLLSCGAKPTSMDKDYYWNALHYAASQDSMDALNEIILSVKPENRKTLVDSLDEHKRSPLMIAVQNGHARTAEKLIMNGADVDLKDTYGRTSLHRAAANGHNECVDLLLDCNAKVELYDFRGRNALYMAATAGHKEILGKLIKFIGDKYGQADLEKTHETVLTNLKSMWFDQDYLTPLHFAAAKGHKGCLEILYEASIGIKSANGFMTPLHCAVESKCEETLEFILKLSNNDLINIPDKYSWTSIYYAVQDDNVNALEKLIFHNADINYQDSNGCTPVMIAAKEGALSCLNFLLECQTLKWGLVDKNNQNILHYAAQSTDDTCGIIILEKIPGLKNLINSLDINQQTPAHLAAYNSLPLFLSALISCGADLYIKNLKNQLPIVACGRNSKASDCIEICLAAMFSSTDSSNLALKTNLNLSPTKTYVINLKEAELEGSIQSSENEYF